MRLAPTLLRPLAILTALAAFGSAAAAQSPSPRDVASRFLSAVSAERWDEAAQLLDLDAFREYVDLFLTRGQRPSAERPIPSVEDLRRQDPSMPREVAEWQVRQIRESQHRMEDPTPFEFARVRSATELRRLRIEEAAARWLEARDPRYVIPRQLEEMGCPAPDDADIPSPRRRLIGTLADGDSVTYGLYREELEFGGPPAGGDFGVVQMRLHRGRWLIEPRGDLLPELSLGMEGMECPSRRSSPRG